MSEAKEEGKRLSYRFRLFPTPEQERYFELNFRCTRFVYNYFLEERIRAYAATKETLSDGTPNPDYDPSAKSMTFYETSKALTKLKKELVDESGHRWLCDADSNALVYALRNLDRAYQNFFRRVKQGGNPGFPRFKSKYDARQSFTVLRFDVDREGYRIILPKVGAVDADIHREVEGAKVSATVSRVASGKYYVSIRVKDVQTAALPENGNAVGIALGVRDWVVTSDGQVYENPKAFGKLARKLAKEQRKLARKQPGSANYRKQKLKVARVNEKIANIRSYETHNLTRQLVNENGVIVSREMPVANMLRSTDAGKGLAKTARTNVNRALIDANLPEINRQLAYKAEWAGRTFLLLSADAPTTRMCSECGHQHSFSSAVGLSHKEWVCPECGAVHNRKFNAAKNVLEMGLEVLRTRNEESSETIM